MRVVMIDGSPRNPANTTQFLDLIQGELGAGIEVDRLRVKDYEISFCKGCLTCEKTNECAIDDVMSSLLERLEAADAVVIGSPVYFGNVPGLLKNFMDRTCPSYWESRLSGKLACWVATQADAAGTLAEHCIDEFCREHGMVVVGGVLCTGEAPGEALESESNVTEVKKLARKLASFLQR